RALVTCAVLSSPLPRAGVDPSLYPRRPLRRRTSAAAPASATIPSPASPRPPRPRGPAAHALTALTLGLDADQKSLPTGSVCGAPIGFPAYAIPTTMLPPRSALVPTTAKRHSPGRTRVSGW